MLDVKTLKSNLDLVAILRQRGLALEPKGENLFARCPFHQDDTPSLSVNPKSQLWSCFGCGVGGDVFSFVQKQEGISFIDAVKKLCKKDIQEKDLKALNLEREKAPLEPMADRPSKDTLDQIVRFWRGALSKNPKAEAYLKSRRLWSPKYLLALQIGYSDGKLPRVLPDDGKLTKQLQVMGLLNEKGNEFFYNRLVVPIFDERDQLVSVYSRAIDDSSTTPHLYLKGPRRGVFNRAAVQKGEPVILTESVFDAVALLVLGLTNVTASFGVNGFTADLRKLLVVETVSRVYCAYDADPAGDQAADQLAHDLANHSIDVYRVALPAKDANEFVMQGGTKKAFQRLLEEAKPIRVSRTTRSESAPVEGEAAVSPLEFTYGERVYRIEGEPARSGGSLRITLKASGYGKKPFVDTINLYSDRARAAFMGRLFAVFQGKAERKQLEEDLFALLEELESRVQEERPESAPVMSLLEEQEARELLGNPSFTDHIVQDLTYLGVVGEDDNKLLAYLVASSRKLKKPLSLSVISRSSAGKSWLLNRVVDLMPAEEVLRYTRMSPRALFYDEPDRFKHKILFIEEAIGAKDADLGVRSMQSEKRLANLVTMTDPKTGKMRTQENIVEGPLTYLTSSVEPLDHETATRSFEVAIDESADQTQRIVTSLFHERTLEGIHSRLDRDTIVKKHQNAQRMLEPLWVVNTHAPRLTFPTGTLRLRREADKYLSLIETIAFLHQVQRPKKTFTHGKETARYIEVELSDIELGNRLMVTCLSRALSDLPGPAQELLVGIRDFVTQRAEGRELQGVTFNRREIRESIGWSDYQVRLYLEMLAELEYIEPVSGSFGKRYVYTLSPDHRLVVSSSLTVDQRIEALGLMPVKKLGKR